MSTIDPLFAQWLMSDGYWQVSTDAVLHGRWADKAQTTERLTTIAAQADAAAEATRQIAFLGGGGPLVIEEHTMRGEWGAYLGQVVNITVDRLGYEAGLNVFIIGVEDNRSTNLSTVTVIRRL